MKIGVACITYNRPEHYKLWMKQIEKHTLNKYDPPVFCVTAYDTDEDRKGVAFRTNEALRVLVNHGCDCFFIFNDDCLIINDGWAEFFIEAHKASGQHHFLFLKETPTIKQQYFEKIAGTGVTIEGFTNCAGCMMFLTKKAIEKVGAFNEEFGLYGFEHAEYSKRVHLAGLTPMGEYLCPAGADKYIYSMDLQNNLPFNKAVKHRPSMKSTEALEHIKKAQPIFEKPILQIHRPL